jgi:carbonic anhydrase
MVAWAGIALAEAAAPKVDPAAALQHLLDGNARYVKGDARRPHQRPSDAPQHPLAVVLSCSDSRVPPEILFDQGVGDLFVVRAAGNTYNQLGLDTIAYAVEHLGTRLIIVMGHDQCGAVTGAVKEYPKPAGAMLENIYPAVKATMDKPGDHVSNAISENAMLIARELRKDPKFSSKVASGELRIVPARYNLANGSVAILPEK